jgi:hypothetical protein
MCSESANTSRPIATRAPWRGPASARSGCGISVFTVPVQPVDKIAICVTYDSDLEKARKLIKQIGLELQKDPEFAPFIIEPLKMRGIDELGDYAVTIRAKMMTVPGELFVIRRKASAMIKKAFDENSIKFAFPTVQVAGEAEPATTAARRRTARPRTDPARGGGLTQSNPPNGQAAVSRAAGGGPSRPLLLRRRSRSHSCELPSLDVRNWQCALKARITCGGRNHPENCRLIW